MSIMVLDEQPGQVNLTGPIPRNKLIDMYRYMRNNFSDYEVEIDSEKSFTDPKLNFIEMSISYDIDDEKHFQKSLKMFKMVWG